MIIGHRLPARRILHVALALLAALWSGLLQANWNTAALMKALAERPAGQVRYSETRHSALLKEPLRMSGTLRYKKPAFLQKHIQTPFEEILTVDGERLSWEKPAAQKKHELALRDYPAIQGFIESMRSTLNGDASTLERFYKLRLDGKEQQWTLVLLPSDIDMAQFIRVIRISGSKARISTIEIEEAGGDRSLMTLREETP
ncbi:MAG: outer membrane lipoprotein carrier protein LolA [Sulfuricella denitrificans]|nr:outer membrane lipoprotein carrier protein LolA [Sulfuricella denitrificans]